MFRIIVLTAMLLTSAALVTTAFTKIFAQDITKAKGPKITFVNLDFEIKTVQYVKYEGFTFRVPIINGYMPSEIKVGANKEGETDVAYSFQYRTPYDKNKVYKKKEGPGSGLSISEKHGDGPEIEVYRCEFYVPVLPTKKL